MGIFHPSYSNNPLILIDTLVLYMLSYCVSCERTIPPPLSLWRSCPIQRIFTRNPSRTNTSEKCRFNPIRINTSGAKDLKSSRINTSKEHPGGGGDILSTRASRLRTCRSPADRGRARQLSPARPFPRPCRTAGFRVNFLVCMQHTIAH
jgi:hypothetical protein